MIFKDTRRLSPVIYEGDLPHEYDPFHKKPDEIPTSAKERTEFLLDNKLFPDILWWRKQYDRCINGYTIDDGIDKGGDAIRDGIECLWKGDSCYFNDYDIWLHEKRLYISGRYYFYLNFWPIYGLEWGGKVKKIIKPRFLDMDFLFDMRMRNMYRYELDNQETKGRQLGYSEKLAGMYMGWNYTFIPASVNLIVAGLQEDADHTMENVVRGLDALINTQFYKQRIRGGNSSSKIQAKDDSQVRSQTAKDKPQTLSRYAPTAVLYEEVGKGKKGWSLEVEGYVRPSLYAEGKKTGWQVWIGTGGKGMEEGVYDLEKRYFDPDKHNILKFPRRHTKEKQYETSMVGAMTPKWMFQVVDIDGNSSREKGIAKLEKAAEGLRDEALYNYWTQHPIYDDSIFMTSTSGYFGKDIILALNMRKIQIRNNRELQIVKRGRLKPKNPKKPFEGVEFVHDEDNWWISIIEEPEKDSQGNVFVNLYKAGTDSYDQDEAETSASEGAFIVEKMFRQGQQSAFYNQTVAMIKERPKTSEGGAELFFYHTVLACIYYRAQNNIEHSKIRIFDYYIKNGFEVLLKERPEMAFAGMIKKSQVSNKYGTDGSLKIPGLSILKNRLTPEYIQRMYFIEQIDALSRFKLKTSSGGAYNCDITMATMEAAIIAKDEEAMVVVSSAEKKRDTYIVFENVNGRLVQKVIKR